MAKIAAIVQSNYIPWKGYFDLIRAADVFVIYDDVQYTKNDWRNRNRIKTSSGVRWLTIPVQHVALNQSILDTRTMGSRWRKKHWNTIAQAYAHAPYFSTYKNNLEQVFLSDCEDRLSKINEVFLRTACDLLGIKTEIRRSEEFILPTGRTERLVALCRALNATEYLSGPSAQNYLDQSQFAKAGISIHYADYTKYPEYPQLHPPFEHAVSILDLLLNTGSAAPLYLKDVGSIKSVPETI